MRRVYFVTDDDGQQNTFGITLNRIIGVVDLKTVDLEWSQTRKNKSEVLTRQAYSFTCDKIPLWRESPIFLN